MGSADSLPSLASIREMLVNAWTEVLGVTVTPGDDFFALGGDSIAAVQVMFPISQLVGTEVPPTLIYAHTTLEQLAVEVERLVCEGSRK
jgi:nonribosomal peptide synthetase MxcG